MKNIQLAEIQQNVLNGDLLIPTIKKSIPANLNSQLNKDIHHSVLINDSDLPIVSFYKKANASSTIKNEYKKLGVKIDDVYFKSDFERLNKNAYWFFIAHEYEEIEEKIYK